jgi:beta-glucanase (GH16 family)
MSSTRYIKYGKISAKLAAIPVPGVVTTFITMSPTKDEIDFEFVGSDQNEIQTNVFYKGIVEYNVHNTKEPISSNIALPHVYEIDWTSETLKWSVDGKLVHNITRETSISPMTPPGERWFPNTPSQIQIAVWDGGSSPDEGTSKWAGGPIPWGSETAFVSRFEWIDIQCYNDKNEIVPSWPPVQNPVNITLPPPTSVSNGTQLSSMRKDGSIASSTMKTFSYSLWSLAGIAALLFFF